MGQCAKSAHNLPGSWCSYFTLAMIDDQSTYLCVSLFQNELAVFISGRGRPADEKSYYGSISLEMRINVVNQ